MLYYLRWRLRLLLRCHARGAMLIRRALRSYASERQYYARRFHDAAALPLCRQDERCARKHTPDARFDADADAADVSLPYAIRLRCRAIRAVIAEMLPVFITPRYRRRCFFSLQII